MRSLAYRLQLLVAFFLSISGFADEEGVTYGPLREPFCADQIAAHFSSSVEHVNEQFLNIKEGTLGDRPAFLRIWRASEIGTPPPLVVHLSGKMARTGAEALEIASTTGLVGEQLTNWRLPNPVEAKELLQFALFEASPYFGPEGVELANDREWLGVWVEEALPEEGRTRVSFRVFSRYPNEAVKISTPTYHVFEEQILLYTDEVALQSHYASAQAHEERNRTISEWQARLSQARQQAHPEWDELNAQFLQAVSLGAVEVPSYRVILVYHPSVPTH